MHKCWLLIILPTMDDDEFWVAWEPPPWVAARGPSRSAESSHFTVRWGEGPASARAERAAPTLLTWLEECWAILCDPRSPSFFVTPYTTASWTDDGLRRKMNVYIAQTGLDPHPCCGGWAHQGTWAEDDVAAVRHGLANPQGKLRHSYLMLSPGAAEAERTVVHEFGHCLQMHTGGHLDTDKVGYQWEAHAEYCVQLRRPSEVGWAPHVPVFVRTAHLPLDCTNYDGEDEGGGRQYIVWPLYAFVDRVFGSRTAHALWHADREQRQTSGVSKDMISNLLAHRGLVNSDAMCRLRASVDGRGDGSARGDANPCGVLAAVFGSFARASLTLDWGSSPHQSAALLEAADPLDPLRFTPLRRCRSCPATTAAATAALSATTATAATTAASAPRAADADAGAPTDADIAADAADAATASWWIPDGSRPLRRCGFATHLLVISHGATDAAVTVMASPPDPTAATAVVPCSLIVSVVGFDPATRARHEAATPHLALTAEGGAAAQVRFQPRKGFEYLLGVCAAPTRDEDFEPLAWGTPPRLLPSYTYSVGLTGCAPHTTSQSGGPPHPGDLAESGRGDDSALAPSATGEVAVPTGLVGLRPVPRLSGGGAALTSIDLRSGNPNETNTVLLPHGLLAARGRSVRAVHLSYRYVVGYSADEGQPGPYFTLELVDGANPNGAGGIAHAREDVEGARRASGGGEGGSWSRRPASCASCQRRWDGATDDVTALTSALACIDCAEGMGGSEESEEGGGGETGASSPQMVHVLYTSPECGARPYSWDAATGGSPTNYSPRVVVVEACAIGPLRGARQTLRLVFRNGRRNMHLQGGGWPVEGCCELNLRLCFD